jgi:predicted RND superfamily exporter protein
LLDIDANTGKPLDYAAFVAELETKVRAKQSDAIRIHVDGFAQLMGDLINGLLQVMTYFFAAAILAAIIIYYYTRCLRSTLLVIGCSLVAVSWQLGVVHLMGYALDPYSILVPFLIFAIGVSHGAQKMNGIMQDIGRGTHRYVAARYTFRRLFLAGATALAADAVGFAVLMIIDIPVIRELAMTASIGVAILVFTNLLLLPVLLSYTGVTPTAAERSLRAEARSEHGVLHWLSRFTEPRHAVITLMIGAVLGIGAYLVSLNVQIGDLEPGASELRANSRYNRDNAFMTENYGLSSDQFSVIIKAPENVTNAYGVGTYPLLIEQDRLAMRLRELPSVQAIASTAEYARTSTAGSYEGSPKWLTLNRDPSIVAQMMGYVGREYPELVNVTWTTSTLTAYLTDHKAATLKQVTQVAKDFAETHSTKDYQFLLAGGSAGIAAATNETVERANRTMLYLVYAAVTLLCFITFRNWRAVIVAVVPLALTTIMAEALMVMLGIGIKVATLPVIALGVGIGVDYALYLLSVQLSHQRAGVPLQEAYRRAVGFTGKVVALVGITLAVGVVTWALSPIKFQADMGILLTFMFVWNMVGALIGIPALSHFLLKDEVFQNSKSAATASA